jgi:hypothetical protein
VCVRDVWILGEARTLVGPVAVSSEHATLGKPSSLRSRLARGSLAGSLSEGQGLC